MVNVINKSSSDIILKWIIKEDYKNEKSYIEPTEAKQSTYQGQGQALDNNETNKSPNHHLKHYHEKNKTEQTSLETNSFPPDQTHQVIDRQSHTSGDNFPYPYSTHEQCDR